MRLLRRAPAPQNLLVPREPHLPHSDPLQNETVRALREFHLFLRAHRLYDASHPSILDSLDAAYDALLSVASHLGGMEVRTERGGIVVAKITEGHLPDARGEFHALACDLQRAGIQTIYFSAKFNVGELDTLAQLIKATLLRSEELAKRNAKKIW